MQMTRRRTINREKVKLYCEEIRVMPSDVWDEATLRIVTQMFIAIGPPDKLR